MKKSNLVTTATLSLLLVPALGTADLNAQTTGEKTCPQIGHQVYPGDADWSEARDGNNDGVGCENQTPHAKTQANLDAINGTSTTEADTTSTTEANTTSTTEADTTSTTEADTTSTTEADTTSTTETKMANTASEPTVFGKIIAFFSNLI